MSKELLKTAQVCYLNNKLIWFDCLYFFNQIRIEIGSFDQLGTSLAMLVDFDVIIDVIFFSFFLKYLLIIELQTTTIPHLCLVFSKMVISQFLSYDELNFYIENMYWFCFLGWKQSYCIHIKALSSIINSLILDVPLPNEIGVNPQVLVIC